MTKYLAVDKQIQHVITLPANLQSSFNPVQLGNLEEFSGLELAEKTLLVHGLGRAMLEFIENVAFEELLIRDANFDWLSGWTVLEVPNSG
jgi:hypothetical protein